MPMSGSLPLGSGEDQTKGDTMDGHMATCAYGTADYGDCCCAEALHLENTKSTTGSTLSESYQAAMNNSVHVSAAEAVAGRVVGRAPKFQKFMSTILDNAKDWTSGERSHISDGETDITADEIRTLLGGDLWDRVEADVKETLEDEIKDEVRYEIEDEIRDEVRGEVLREVQDAIENL